MTQTALKMMPPKILRWCINVFTELLPGIDRAYYTDSQTHVSNNSSILACSRCLATKWGICFKSLCLAMIGEIHIQTHRLMGGIYEVGRHNGLKCTIHTKFHKDWFRHSKANVGYWQTHSHHGDNISLLSFFSK
jgi:hypothetical protein